MESIKWHGEPGHKNKGHEIDFGTAPAPFHATWGAPDLYYYSLCGHRVDDPHFRVWVYCHKGWKHLGPSDGFETADEARAFADSVDPEQYDHRHATELVSDPS